MKQIRTALASALAFLGALATQAQDYRPFIPVCVVDGGELRTGMTARYNYEGKWYVVGFCSSACRIRFIQNPASCMAAALAALAHPVRKEPTKDKKVPTGPCDLRHLVKIPWCPLCDRELGRDDMRNGICKRCESKSVQAEFCVKGSSPDDRARITYACDSCGATGDLESKFKHTPDCTRKPGAGLKKICSRSGIAPHATDSKP